MSAKSVTAFLRQLGTGRGKSGIWLEALNLGNLETCGRYHVLSGVRSLITEQLNNSNK